MPVTLIRVLFDREFKNDASIDDILFEDKKSYEILRKLDRDLGGLDIVHHTYFIGQSRCHLALNIDVEDGSRLKNFFGIGDASLRADGALETILKNIQLECVSENRRLIVDPYSLDKGRREFEVTGSANAGFKFTEAACRRDFRKTPRSAAAADL